MTARKPKPVRKRKAQQRPERPPRTPRETPDNPFYGVPFDDAVAALLGVPPPKKPEPR